MSNENTITTPWGFDDFIGNPEHTLQLRAEVEKGYCARCGDEVKWQQPGPGITTMAPDNLVHLTKRHKECRDCYTPRLADSPVQPADLALLLRGTHKWRHPWMYGEEGESEIVSCDE